MSNNDSTDSKTIEKLFFEKSDFYSPFLEKTLKARQWISKKKIIEDDLLRIAHFFLSQIPPSSTFLDFGCGNGWAIIVALKRKPSMFCVGVDSSSRLVKEAANNIRTSGKRSQSNFVICDCCQMPFRNGAFDAVVDLNVIHHLPSIQEGVAAIYHALKRNGHCLIVEAVSNNLFLLLGRWFNRCLRMSFSSGVELDFTWQELSNFLHSIGFDVQRRGHQGYLLWIPVMVATRYPRVTNIMPNFILIIVTCLELILQNLPLFRLFGSQVTFICRKQ